MIKQRRCIPEFFKFGVSGTVGFLVDAGIVTLLTREVGMHPLPAQFYAFSIAVTTTWLINRNWTFAGRTSERWIHEWTRYVAANSLGALINNIVYATLVLTLSLFSNWPQLAVAAGSIAGMCVNFITSSQLVFVRSHDHDSGA
ncbi:MAG: GtrA family protein [Syntrophobacteraceae bacterium]